MTWNPWWGIGAVLVGGTLVALTREDETPHPNRDWEAVFNTWSQPVSETEDQRCQNALSVLQGIIDKSEALKAYEPEVFVQGSYRRDTNVRANSDIDICIRSSTKFFVEQGTDVPDNFVTTNAATQDDYYTFKAALEKALTNHFGWFWGQVERGNKVFRVHSNTYRVDADILATFTHRRYYRRRDSKIDMVDGAGFLCDDGTQITNWPEHNLKQTMAKNKATEGRYQETVRIFKRLLNEMREQEWATASEIPSFLLEAALHNVESEAFKEQSHKQRVEKILSTLIAATEDAGSCKHYKEMNRRKWLFSKRQQWTPESAHHFFLDAWRYIGLAKKG